MRPVEGGSENFSRKGLNKLSVPPVLYTLSFMEIMILPDAALHLDIIPLEGKY